MATTSRAKKGRILIGKSLRLLENHKRLFIFPVLGYICRFAIFAAIITPFLHNYEQLEAINHMPAGDVILVIVVFMVLLFFVNLISFFFNTAIIANLLYYLRHRQEASIAFGFVHAYRCYGAVFLWAVYAGSIGIVLNLFPRNKSKYKLLSPAILRGNHWHVASMLAFSHIMDNKTPPVTAMKESSRLVEQLWGTNLRANYSFFGILFILRMPMLLAFIFTAIFAQSHLTIIIVGLIAALLILFGSTFYQMVNTTLRVVSYCYAEHKIVAETFNEETIQRLFIKRVS